LILFIITVALGVGSMYSPALKDAKNKINNKINDLVYPDFDNYLSGPNPFQGIKDMFDNLKNKIPGDLKYKFSSFRDSVSYITTGRNQYEDYLTPRNTITSGRCDNIIHMNFNNQSEFQKEKTFCALQPKPVSFNFNSNLYQNADYNKLDKDLRTNLRYPNKYEIPINGDDTGRFTFDINNSHYFNPADNNIQLNTNFNYLPKLFKKNNKEIIFNEYIQTSFNQFAGLISMYSVKLLNKKHKDPIMVVSEMHDNPPKKTKTISLYYNNDTSYNYYDQNNIFTKFEFDFNNYYYDIEMLLDQSGYNRHFVWKNNDNKYKPNIVLKNGEYAIEFQSRSILYQNIPIAFPKMFIKSTIMVNSGKSNDASYKAFQIIDGYMDFLSTTTTSSIKIDISTGNRIKYNVKTNNQTKNEQYDKIEYSINTKETIMTNLDDGNIETIGCILDARNLNQKIEDNVEIVGPHGLAKGRNLDSITKAHNFVGYLYDLYIYDRTKM
jgi:hypothetical protein